ncbi:MAG: Ig-like domain repeat protein [Dehalococcoidia bacterium]|nr:Ig-like domain repeat protein [Dehalococcoidia bacterium]
MLPAAAPGTVQFKLNGVNFGTPVPVSGGSATLAWIPDVLGTDIAVTASFASGSANYLSDLDSNSVPVDVTAAAVTITISAAAGVTVGDSISLDAALKPSAAPGTVSFFADGTEVSGSGGVAADTTDGVTTFSWTPSSIGDGTATISATYTSSSSNYAGQATSANDDVTINKAASSVSEVTVTPSSVTAVRACRCRPPSRLPEGARYLPARPACSSDSVARPEPLSAPLRMSHRLARSPRGGCDGWEQHPRCRFAHDLRGLLRDGLRQREQRKRQPNRRPCRGDRVDHLPHDTGDAQEEHGALLSVTLSPGTAPGTIAVYQDGVAVGASVTVTGGAMTISWNAPNDNNTYSLTVVLG